MESNHFVTAHISSKCSELERILSDLNQSFESRVDFLNQMHDVLLDIEEVCYDILALCMCIFIDEIAGIY